MKKIANALRNVGVVDALQVLLIILKTADIISWSWWVVFIPALFNIVIVSIVAILVFVFKIDFDY